MSPKTKKRLVVAGGIAGGAVVLVGLVALLTKNAAASSGTAPTASDSDIGAVVAKALAVETDPAILRQLATAMMVIPYGNPLRNQIGVLQARADTLEAGPGVVQGDQGATAHVRQF